MVFDIGFHFGHNFGKNVQRIFCFFRIVEIVWDSQAAQPKSGSLRGSPGRSGGGFSEFAEISFWGRVYRESPKLERKTPRT